MLTGRKCHLKFEAAHDPNRILIRRLRTSLLSVPTIEFRSRTLCHLCGRADDGAKEPLDFLLARPKNRCIVDKEDQRSGQ
jgi:hypothetical protein